jgi:hypothetical protein
MVFKINFFKIVDFFSHFLKEIIKKFYYFHLNLMEFKFNFKLLFLFLSKFHFKLNFIILKKIIVFTTIIKKLN